MRALKLVLVSFAMGWSLLSTAAQPAGVRISQVVERTPELLVFISTAAPALPGATASGTPQYTAALGSTPLRVKSTEFWDKSEGVALVVAIDVSASLGEAGFKAVKAQIGSVIAQLPPRSQVALVAIGSQPKVVHEFGSAATATGAALQSLAATAPETALYEGILLSQEMAAQASSSRPRRRAVLVFTDGIDDSRRGVGREETLQKISKGDAPVFALALMPQRPLPSQIEAVKSLAQITRASGGNFAQATSVKATDALSALLADMLRSSLLTVDCTGCSRDGMFRSLQITRQQDDISVTDMREIRLLAPAPAAAIPGSSGVATASRAHESATTGQSWIVAAVALLLALIAVLFYWIKIRRIAIIKSAGVTFSKPEEFPQYGDHSDAQNSARTRAADQGAATTHAPQIGKRVTLHVAGQGRLQLQVAREIMIGRSKTADVCLASDPEASSRHAVLYFEGRGLMVRDLGSSNGTSLNGTTITKPEPVEDGDVILVGRTEVRIYFGNA